MAFILSSTPNISAGSSFPSTTSLLQKPYGLIRSQLVVTKCELNNESKSSSDVTSGAKKALKLEIGSPIIMTEAPLLLKTAASVPCLRANGGLVKPGDVGRIVSRKPKDVWAVRLSIGTYLIDGKYFKPLELDE